MQKIIFSGKGGAGKTTITSLFVTQLIKTYPNIKLLLIDADPSHNLSISLGISEQVNSKPIGELENFLPSNWDNQEQKIFDLFEKDCITKIKYLDNYIDYAFMGDHTRNSCMCSYNNALNYILKYINQIYSYDLVLIDREAGVEHINRSVYGDKNDKLIILTWPTSEYIQVAKQILDLADILGTTSKRLLIINNSQNINFTEEEISIFLKELKLDSINRIIFPYINIFKKFKKLTSTEILEINKNNQELQNALNQLISFAIN